MLIFRSVLRGTEMSVSKSWFHSILKCSKTFQKRNYKCELANKDSKQYSDAKQQAPWSCTKDCLINKHRPSTLPNYESKEHFHTAEGLSFLLSHHVSRCMEHKACPSKSKHPNDKMTRTVQDRFNIIMNPEGSPCFRKGSSLHLC